MRANRVIAVSALASLAFLAVAVAGVVDGASASAGGSTLIPLPSSFPTLTMPPPSVTFGSDLPTITLAEPGACSITVSPTNSQFPGGPVTVTGQNWWQPSGGLDPKVFILLETTVMTTSYVDDYYGTFSATFNMPAWGTAVTYSLRAAAQDNWCLDSPTIQYGVDDLSGSAPGCTLGVDPKGGSFVGAPVSLHITGVEPGELVTVSHLSGQTNVIWSGTPSIKAIFGIPGFIPAFVPPGPGAMYLESNSCNTSIPYNYYGEGFLPTLDSIPPGVTFTMPQDLFVDATGVTFSGQGTTAPGGNGNAESDAPVVTNEEGQAQIGVAFDGTPLFAAGGAEGNGSSNAVLLAIAAALALGIGFIGGLVWSRRS